MYDTRIPQSAIPVARETLALSDAARGLQGMTPPNTGMTNMDTGRAYANADGTTFGQVEEQMALANQELTQNMQTAASQQNVAARGAVIAQTTELNDADAKAQAMMNNRLVNILDLTGNGGALMQLNALVQSPEREQFINSIATTRAMGGGQALLQREQFNQQLEFLRNNPYGNQLNMPEYTRGMQIPGNVNPGLSLSLPSQQPLLPSVNTTQSNLTLPLIIGGVGLVAVLILTKRKK